MTRLSVDYAGLVRGLRVPLAPADLGTALLDADNWHGVACKAGFARFTLLSAMSALLHGKISPEEWHHEGPGVRAATSSTWSGRYHLTRVIRTVTAIC
jgi:hypothetical protein